MKICIFGNGKDTGKSKTVINGNTIEQGQHVQIPWK